MNDREIARLFAERDEKAIEEISRKYGGYCHSIAKNILQNDEDAEECVNDAYLKLWENVHEKNPASLKLFLAKIVRNLALNKYEEKKREKRGGGEVTLALDEISEIVSGTVQTEAEASYSELVRAVNSFLRARRKGNNASRKLYVVQKRLHSAFEGSNGENSCRNLQGVHVQRKIYG